QRGGGGGSHHEFRRRRGWGYAASTRVMTRDEGSGERTGGLLRCRESELGALSLGGKRAPARRGGEAARHGRRRARCGCWGVEEAGAEGEKSVAAGQPWSREIGVPCAEDRRKGVVPGKDSRGRAPWEG
ncbi:hypothetical protein ACJX0J_020830, partial [Zea mays]